MQPIVIIAVVALIYFIFGNKSGLSRTQFIISVIPWILFLEEGVTLYMKAFFVAIVGSGIFYNYNKWYAEKQEVS